LTRLTTAFSHFEGLFFGRAFAVKGARNSAPAGAFFALKTFEDCAGPRDLLREKNPS